MSRRLVVVLLGAALLTACASASNPNRPPASGPGVYFIEPAQGATVTSPFKVKFGIQGMDVKPAGEQVAGSGHHHLLIGLESQAKGEIIPVDDQHIHFGKGQTETEVTLPPGTYKLTAQFANGAHQSYGPALSQTITIKVK